MSSTLTAETALLARAQALLPGLRAGERVSVVFFLYLSALAWVWHGGAMQRIVLLAIPAGMLLLGTLEAARSTAVTRVARDFLSLGLILAGYWSIGWFAAPPLVQRQEQWLGWDRILLNQWGLRATIESAGSLFPSVLEVLYLLLYAVPPICLCAIYWVGGRERVHAFLHTLLLGTLSAYALLPLIPVHGPHVVYPTLDLPQMIGLARPVNLWVLDHMDIPTSVFPSGHVAVAFSAAFGMLRAVRTRPALWGAAFAVATAVYLATVYCRYHYAVDGLASIIIAAAAWMVSDRGGDVA